MARTDDDSWDITEGVGTTALGAAANRAREAASDSPLVTDEYAHLFVEAAMARGWTPLNTSDVARKAQTADPETGRRLEALAGYGVCRTKWFDEFAVAAAKGGIRQFVMLATGLDSRAWRLPWPPGTAVYEIDQPKVLQFKLETLDASGVGLPGGYASVPIDLRHDWVSALCEKGFDPNQATGWTAEGLLAYLPLDAQNRLFEQINAVSASGSRMAVDKFRMSAEDVAQFSAHMQRLKDAAASVSGTDETEPDELFFADGHADVATWLSGHGWRVNSVEARDQMARCHRAVPADLHDAVAAVFVEGVRLTNP